MKIEKPRGTRDFAPEDMERRIRLEKVFTDSFKRYGYNMIGIPTFEHAELFELKSGEEIEGHMYVFEDKKGRKLCLRPEATASVARMFAETLRSLPRPLKLCYHGPMFRYEEPQKGRYREFWQTGLELIGPEIPESDAEVIKAAYDPLERLGLKFTLEVGHLGVLRGLLEELGTEENAMAKIIACIDKNDQETLLKLTDDETLHKLIKLKGEKDVMEKAGKLLKDRPKAINALKKLAEVLSLLDLLKVRYTVNLGIARGLEYYTGMVFEIRAPGLGAQNQICGGGRYDGLMELFSGLSVPAVGFAYGFDRVIEAMESQGIKTPKTRIDAIVAPVNEEVRREALKIASRLREEHTVQFDLMNRKLGKILEYAAQIDARYAVIVGSKDLKEGCVTVRYMESGKQETVKIEDIAAALKRD